MQLKRAARFIWRHGEGRLPKELQDALAEGERRKWTIRVALCLYILLPRQGALAEFQGQKSFLFHQAPTEYVLIFSEG